MTLDEFTEAYIEAALWSSHDDSTEAGGEPFDANYSPEDIHPDTLSRMVDDCQRFQSEHGIPDYHDPRYGDEEKAGHDFWLTRNGHGAGFWDRDELPEGVKERLTEASHAFGEFDLYLGDDGKIHGS